MIACATYQGASPFLADIKPKAKQETSSISNQIIKIINYEHLILNVTSSGVHQSSNGFTVTDFGRVNSCAIVGSCTYVSATFKASSTKHAKYIYKASVVGGFDNFVAFKIYGKAVTTFGETIWNDYQPKGYITFLNQSPSNSSLFMDVYVKDDGPPDNMSCYIDVTLYYK